MPHVAKSYTKKQVMSFPKRSLNSNSEKYLHRRFETHPSTHRVFMYCKWKPYSQAPQLRSKNSVPPTVTISYFSGYGVTLSTGAPAPSSDSQIPPRHFQGEKGVVGECGSCYVVSMPVVLSLLPQLTAGCHVHPGVEETEPASVPMGLTLPVKYK